MLNHTAPIFELQASDDSIISNQDLKSYMLLLFYPMNDTPTCDRQLHELSTHIDEFKKRNVLVYGVNPAKLQKHQNYCSRKQLTFSILSDEGGKVAKQFKTHMNWLPINQRTVVVIDSTNTVCFYERGVPSIQEIIAAIDQRQQQQPTVTPA